MNAWKLALPSLLAAAVLAAPAYAAACDSCGSKAQHEGHVTKAAATAPAAGKVAKGVRTIEIAVTEEGFTPATVTAKAGETVKLVVTRKVDQTCATEIVMKSMQVEEALPLGKPVTVTVKPTMPGNYGFSCAMGHITGKLVVE